MAPRAIVGVQTYRSTGSRAGGGNNELIGNRAPAGSTVSAARADGDAGSDAQRADAAPDALVRDPT